MAPSPSDTVVETAGNDRRLADLMVGYQRGDARAFEDLYKAISGEIRRYLAWLCGDLTLAEDLAQESFLQIHRARHTYMPGRPFRPWAFAIARRVHAMERRSRFRRRMHEWRYPSPAWCLSADLEGLARREDLARALAVLTPERREALVLHHAFDCSFEEIGALTGAGAGAAKVRSHRALRQLREWLDVKNPEK